MNRPAFTNYVLGSAASVAAMAGVTAFVAYRWCTQEEHGESINFLVPIVALYASSACFKARARVSTYTAWRRSWDEMSGATPPGKAGTKRAPGAWMLAGLASWAALLCWLIQHQGEKTNEVGFLGLVWLCLTAWGVGRAGLGILRWAFRPARPAGAGRRLRERVRQHIVSICLPIPWVAPRAGDTIAAIPGYARALVARDRQAAATRGGLRTDSVQWN
jgi:hypothetical protein